MTEASYQVSRQGLREYGSLSRGRGCSHTSLPMTSPAELLDNTRRRIGPDVTGRLQRRAKRALLRVTGLAVGELIGLDAENAKRIAARYDRVTTELLVEPGGIAEPMVTRLPEDSGWDWVGPFPDGYSAVLLDIANPRFSFRNELLHDPQLNVLFGAGFTRPEVLGMRGYAPRRCREVGGTVAYLSNTWIDNYYHWLQLTVPLLRVYAMLRPGVRIDAYYVGAARLSAFQRETLARLGVRPEQVIQEPCRAERMLAAFCRYHGRGPVRFRPRAGHDFVRELFAPACKSAGGGPRRLYLRRGRTRTRHLENEQALISFLSRHGFVPVTMDGLSVQEQAALFAGAEAIVSVHGSALTNLLFASPNTMVIEIFPFDYPDAAFFATATYAGANYGYLRCEPPSDKSGALVLDMDRFEQLFECMALAPCSGSVA